MNDSVIYYFENNLFTEQFREIHDTSLLATDTTAVTAGRFFVHVPVNIAPEAYQPESDSWFVYVLLMLSLGVAMIWYYIPERLSSVFSLSAKTVMGRQTDKGRAVPGLAVNMFFLVNSVITMSFLVLLAVKEFTLTGDIEGLKDMQVLGGIALILVSLSLVKLFLIRSSGFIFKTSEMAAKQQAIYLNSYNTTGVVLLPLLFVLLILQGKILLYITLGVVIVMFLYRWKQTVVIGINLTHFNTFHLILYLCTLEIIPMLVLLKIFM